MTSLLEMCNLTNKSPNAKTWLLFSEFAYNYGHINEDEYNKIQSKYGKGHEERVSKIKLFFTNYVQNFERMKNQV